MTIAMQNLERLTLAEMRGFLAGSRRIGFRVGRWCMNRNLPATNLTHRSITYQERTTIYLLSSAIRLRM